jgi:3-oxoacyl-[acyl-carrier-protein] synthase II
VQKSWDALLKGVSGVRKIEHFDASQHACQIAAEVRDFDPLDFVERKEAKRTDRFTQFALACATMAVEDAGLSITQGRGDRIGCLLGVGLGGLSTIERNYDSLLRSGPDRVSPFMVPMLAPNIAAGQVSMRFGLRGPNSCVSTACGWRCVSSDSTR